MERKDEAAPGVSLSREDRQGGCREEALGSPLQSTPEIRHAGQEQYVVGTFEQAVA